jgi:hypothetical protein
MALCKYVNETSRFQILIFLNQERVLAPNNSVEFDSNLQSYVEIRSYDFITSLIADRVPLGNSSI